MLLSGYRRVLDTRMGRKATKAPRGKRSSTNSEPAYITRLAQDPIHVASPLPTLPPRNSLQSIGLTPFRHICPMCHRSFHWLCSLKRHILTHIDGSDIRIERPTSGSPSIFPAFQRRFEPLRPYICEKCDADFETNSLLMRHINNVHGYPLTTNHFGLSCDRTVQVARKKLKRALKHSNGPGNMSTKSSTSYVDSSTESSVRSGYSDDDGLGVEKKLDRLSAQQKQITLPVKKTRLSSGRKKIHINGGGKTVTQLTTVKDKIFM